MAKRPKAKMEQTTLALGLLLPLAVLITQDNALNLEEITVEDIHVAFKAGTLTSRTLVEFYLERIAKLNPLLHAVIEVNPDALLLADKADAERNAAGGFIGGLHGIPILLKDNIATFDKMNTTAGSYALLGSKVPRDAGVARRLREVGAILLGKANLSEWANYRSTNSSNGWSGRGGQTKDPYVLSGDVCGSSSGSGAGTAANLAAVSLGTETDGSILCPSSRNSIVGIKPSVGLTSRAGVVPLSHSQDTVGPMCRTLADAVAVLEIIVGFDPLDPSTAEMSKCIPKGGYKQFLKKDGLKGKRIGILRHPFFDDGSSDENGTVGSLIDVLQKEGAIVVDNVVLADINETSTGSESLVLLFEFKHNLGKYLAGLLESPVRTLEDVIDYNNAHANLELNLFGQEIFYMSQNTTGLQSKVYEDALKRGRYLTSQGIDKTFSELDLDALVGPSIAVTSLIAKQGYPGISVPAGYTKQGLPYGMTFLGKKTEEPRLIEVAYGYEQATKMRKPPQFLP